MMFSCPTAKALADKTFWTGYGADGYDKINGAFSPSNDALYVGQLIAAMYRSWYGVDVLQAQQKTMPLVMRVHYGQRHQNAFWDGHQMTFGDGGDLLYPLVSLGVGAHEVSHGFTEQQSNLNYYGQAGGINEAFSDMAAQAAESFARGYSSWRIGAEILKETSGYEAMRFMDKPSRDGHSIDRVNQYRPGMDVHYSSGVYNRMFYELAHQPGWDTRKAFELMVKANRDYWVSNSDFSDAACGLLNAADDLDFPAQGIQQALNEVGIDDSDCEKS